jgi:hypothetical protein
MATSKFFITDNPSEESDGIIKTADKETIGLAWQNEAPNGFYITGKLDGFVIISKEEYNKLKYGK